MALFGKTRAKFARGSRKESQRADVPPGLTPSGMPQSPQGGYESPPSTLLYVSPWSPNGPKSFLYEEPRHAWGPEFSRIPRPFYPNLRMLAGLSSVDGANNSAHWLFLPPMEPFRRAATSRAIAGGSNRVSGGSGLQSVSHFPSVFVPIGR